MAVLVDHYGWTQGWTLYIAAVFGFVVGCLTSLPALRLKGVYLALTSIGLAVLFPQLVKWQKLEWLTDGARGIDDLQYDDIPEWPILGELDGRRGRAVWMYWLAVIIVVVSYLVCRGIVKSRVGRSLIAIRDNETAAAVMGVNRRPDADDRLRTLGGDDRGWPAPCSASGSTASTRTCACSP